MENAELQLSRVLCFVSTRLSLDSVLMFQRMPRILRELPTCVPGGLKAGNFSTALRINTLSHCQSAAHQSFKAPVIYIVLAPQSQKNALMMNAVPLLLFPLSERAQEGS